MCKVYKKIHIHISSTDYNKLVLSDAQNLQLKISPKNIK